MPKHQAALLEVLSQMGFREAPKPARPRLSTLPQDARAAIIDLYRQLGGVQKEPRLVPGAWDSAYGGNLVVELDESQHFNRYRALTLTPDWAKQLRWRDAYLDYSDRFEGDCVNVRGWGGYWSNDSAERMFGQPGPQRDLVNAGSPRWKQRALYDAMRDVFALHGGIRLARLAIYDEVGDVQLGRALEGTAQLDPDALRVLIEERTV